MTDKPEEWNPDPDVMAEIEEGLSGENPDGRFNLDGFVGEEFYRIGDILGEVRQGTEFGREVYQVHILRKRLLED